MIIRILSALVLLAVACVVPLYFEQVLFFMVGKLHIGWILSTILIRLLVILLVFFALKQFFRLSERLSKIKSWLVLLIAILPGFGISFIAPIYSFDYGNFNSDFVLTNTAALEDSLKADLIPQSDYAIIAFFTTSCPHCMAASNKLGINIEGGQNVPVTTIFPGTEGDSKAFLEKNRGQKFNAFQMDNDHYFVQLSGGAFPSIFLINHEGTTLKHWIGDELNYTALDYLKSLQ
jgi:hypothetical protein